MVTITEKLKSFVEGVVDFIFQKPLEDFDTLSNKLKHQHESPSSYDIKEQLTYLKEHLNGHKISSSIDSHAYDNNDVKPIGETEFYNNDSSFFG